MISHEHPRFCDPDYHPFPSDFGGIETEPPIYCTGCHDTEVEQDGQVCRLCLASTQDDWVSYLDYLSMRVAALLFAAKEVHNGPSC